MSADILAQTDEYVGDLLDTIDEVGLKDDTIFIFTSDNGGYGGIEREGFNGPWRGGIYTSYEGAYRVPFLIRWPGKIPAMRKSNQIVHAMDVYATLAAMVGAEIPSDRASSPAASGARSGRAVSAPRMMSARCRSAGSVIP